MTVTHAHTPKKVSSISKISILLHSFVLFLFVYGPFIRAFAGKLIPTQKRQLFLAMAQSKDGVPKEAKEFASCMGTAHAITGAWGFLEKGVQFGPVELDTVKIMTSRMFRDIDQGKWRKFIQYQSYSMQPGQPETGSWQEVGFPLELTGATAFSPSPDGQKLLVLREEGSDKKEWVMDVYDNHHLIHKWGLGSIHEKPCNDGWFGCVSWSSCGKYAVYVAERKAPKTKSWFAKDEKKPDKKKDEKKEDEEKRGEEFAWREDWGEKYVGTVDLGLFVVNLENGKVKEIKGAPDDLTIGSPVFSADAKHVVYTAWNNLPNKLGMIYCYQRPCKLYACNIEEILEEMNKADKEEPKEEEEETKKDGTGNEQDKKEDEKEKTPEHICLTPNARLSRTPRFSPDGTKLAYVTNPEGFATHGGAFQLSIMDWQGWNKAPGTSPESSVLVDIVANPGPDDFPGIWGDSVPSKCWAPDGSSIFLTSAWRSSVSVLKIDALSGQVTRMQEFGSILEGDETSGPLEKASSSLFEVGPYGALFAASCPSNPGGLGVAFAKEGDKFLENMHVTPAARNVSSLQFPHTATCKLTAEETAHLADKVKRVNWRVLEIQPDDGGPTFDAILWLPPESATKKWASEGEENALPPLIVTPHGGPHGLCSTSYIPAYAWQVAAQGYALLLVNYRGSIGFGKDALDSLPGNCGTQDVADVLAATKAAMELSPPVVNPERVAVVGGSHGGFLAGHMIGQHADVYKVGVMRNPVTNIASMVGVTDIRDWCFVEALGHQGYDFDTYQIPTSEDLAKMWAASPIAHAQKVKAPTLLCVGAMDRRVPCSQSVEYYNVLKSLGVKTKMLWYPEDVHAIDIVKSDADEWVNLMNWLNEHI